MSDEHPLPNPEEVPLKNVSENALDKIAEEMWSFLLKSEPKVGDTIGGRYKLLEDPKEGGFGVVYRADDQKLNREVAFKMIKPEKILLGINTKQVIERFKLEVQVLTKLDHPNIARIYDAGKTKKGRPYFVMEYIKGEKITDYAKNKKLTIYERLDLFRKVCLAVHYAHEQGFIHRDIKPSNILVTEESGHPEPKVIDFGIVKAIEPEPVTHSLTTTTRHVCTTDYASPEQTIKIDERSDIYSLGVLLYELIIGYIPSSTEDLEDKKDKYKTLIKSGKYLSPSKRFKKTSKEKAEEIIKDRQIGRWYFRDALFPTLNRIIMKCIKKDPDDRYQTAKSLASTVQRYLRFRSPFIIKIVTIISIGVIILGSIAIFRMLWFDYRPYWKDKDIYLKVEEAIKAPTFARVQSSLNKIDTTKITNPHLTRYIEIGKETAGFCVKVGIQKNGEWSNIVNSVVITNLYGKDGKPLFDLMKEGWKVQGDIPEFYDLKEGAKLYFKK